MRARIAKSTLRCVNARLLTAAAPARHAHTGGAEGPWDHATRLEALAQRFNLHFVGVADPLTEKAAGVVKARAAGTRGDLYTECNVYDSHQRMLAEAAPDVVRWPVLHGRCVQCCSCQSAR